VDQAKEDELGYKPQFPILKSFEDQKGIYDLINVAVAVVKTYKNKNSREIWLLWLQELKSFSALKGFYNLFSQDYSKAESIYKLIGGEFDASSQETDQEEQIKTINKLYHDNVRYTYRIIGELFEENKEQSLREACISNGTYKKFLDRLSQLTGEKPRKKRDPNQ
jgi:hypothetical protein